MWFFSAEGQNCHKTVGHALKTDALVTAIFYCYQWVECTPLRIQTSYYKHADRRKKDVDQEPD